jgi:hypothetical protein
MRPKQPQTTGSGDLFRARLDQIINMKHELVQLAGKLGWAWIDGEIAPLYSPRGRPGIETRFVIGLSRRPLRSPTEGSFAEEPAYHLGQATRREAEVVGDFTAATSQSPLSSVGCPRRGATRMIHIDDRWTLR